MDAERISDAEEILRWVDRSNSDKFQPPGRITSGNFKLRVGESGISVYLRSRRSIESILAAVTTGSPESYLFIVASTGDVRSLKDGAGVPLNLDVILNEEMGNNPGHSLIVGEKLKSSGTPKALASVFRIIES